MKLDKKTVRAAQRLIQKSPRVVNESAVLKTIVEELDIADIRNKKIYFTAENLAYIEKYFDNALEAPLLAIDLDVDTRFLAAKKLKNEKWARGGVFDGMLSMAGKAPIPVIGSTVHVPPGIVYSMRYEKLDITKIHTLLIVENGELITNWDKVIPHLPKEYQNALILFKGYGENQNHLKIMLNELNPSVNVGIFFDHDAAGIDMALKLSQYCYIDIVVPIFLSDSILMKSKAGEFEKQFPQLFRRINCQKTPPQIKSILEDMEKRKLAITQEHLITHSTPLGLIKGVKYND